MCKILKVPRSTFYYKPTTKVCDAQLENAVIQEFRASRNNFGTRKLKIVLARKTDKHEPIFVSRRRIRDVMRKYNLVSNYTIKTAPKGKKLLVNNDEIPNIVNREFDNREPLEVVVSDLTYVKVAGKWNYICLLIDLQSRMIIGFAAGKSKSAQLVKKAFFSVQTDLRKVKLFHTDRGSEFKNFVIEQILTAFKIERSLSAKGSPIDNAVSESMYSVVKTEFAFQREFVDFDELELDLFDWVNWYNYQRPHGSLGYRTPSEAAGAFPG